jgi:Domain of unknown function (DUF1992)
VVGIVFPMSERKPLGVSWESWVERQIREGIDDGAFANLSGAGKPIAGLDEPHDEEWWVKEKLRREEVAFLPPTLAIKRELQEAKALIATAVSEPEVIQLIDDINARIREVNSRATAGPPSTTMPLDKAKTLETWRASQPSETDPIETATADPAHIEFLDPTKARRRGRWRLGMRRAALNR